MWTLPTLESLQSWLQEWIQHTLLPLLKIQLRIGAVGMIDGVMDMVLLAGLLTTAAVGGNYYMERQYTLSRQAQQQIVTWAAVSERAAREAGVPPVTPLVLWYKEGGLNAVNPDNCEGIMGLHDLIVTREHACFTPGPISSLEIAEQLRIGAREFKKRCPQVHYTTTDPAVLKRCYLAYNAGPNARMNPDWSGYVMNGYDAARQNMIHRDVQGNVYRLKNLGAWPTHLAVASLLVNLEDSPDGARVSQFGIERAFQPAVDMLTRWRDQLAYGLDLPPWVKWLEHPQQQSPVSLPVVAWRAPRVVDCLIRPHTGGDPELRPTLNPVMRDAVLTQDLHGCSYDLPGLDISSTSDRASPLQAPMPGEVMTYTDRWQNTTIRIENGEWIVTMLHSRSYVVRRGAVLGGRQVGVMGAQGRATGPHVHFAIYDKIGKGYVDPGAFVPDLTQTD